MNLSINRKEVTETSRGGRRRATFLEDTEFAVWDVRIQNSLGQRPGSTQNCDDIVIYRVAAAGTFVISFKPHQCILQLRNVNSEMLSNLPNTYLVISRIAFSAEPFYTALRNTVLKPQDSLVAPVLSSVWVSLASPRKQLTGLAQVCKGTWICEQGRGGRRWKIQEPRGACPSLFLNYIISSGIPASALSLFPSVSTLSGCSNSSLSPATPSLLLRLNKTCPSPGSITSPPTCCHLLRERDLGCRWSTGKSLRRGRNSCPVELHGDICRCSVGLGRGWAGTHKSYSWSLVNVRLVSRWAARA